MTRRLRRGDNGFVPALGFHALTALYDPMIQRWSAARRVREAVIDALGLKPGMRVLELGAGPGRLAIDIKHRCPGASVTALDIDPSMLARARRNAEHSGVHVELRQGDMTELRALGSFDRICSTMTFHHLAPAEKRRALSAARSALGAGGRFVVADFGRPNGLLQWALFCLVQQPLDGFANTTPHRDGSYRQDVFAAFSAVHSGGTWRTAAGTLEMLVCDNGG